MAVYLLLSLCAAAGSSHAARSAAGPAYEQSKVSERHFGLSEFLLLYRAARVVSAANRQGNVEGGCAVADGIGLLDGDAVQQGGVRQHVGRIDHSVTGDLGLFAMK